MPIILFKYNIQRKRERASPYIVMSRSIQVGGVVEIYIALRHYPGSSFYCDHHKYDYAITRLFPLKDQA